MEKLSESMNKLGNIFYFEKRNYFILYNLFRKNVEFNFNENFVNKF